MSKSSKREVRPLTSEQQQMVLENMKYAKCLAHRFYGWGVEMKDLEQEACYGLCRAAQNYDEGRGAKFESVAYFWCMKYLWKAVRYKPNVTLIRFEDDYTGGDEEVDDDEGVGELAAKINALLDTLTDREREVIKLLYGFEGDPMDFFQVAQKLHLTSKRVHQIYEKAMNSMAFSKC